MTTPTPTCPTCAGPFLTGHAGGPFVVRHVPNGCALGAAQDATQAADHQRLADPYGPASFDRPATAAEITLGARLGLPLFSTVTIRRVTSAGGVTRREPVTP